MVRGPRGGIGLLGRQLALELAGGDALLHDALTFAAVAALLVSAAVDLKKDSGTN